LEQYLRIYADYDQLNWVANLPLAELAYNTTIHDATQMTPLEIVYDYTPTIVIELEMVPDIVPTARDWTEQILDNHLLAKLQLDYTIDSMKNQADRHRRDTDIRVGMKVYINRQNIKTQQPCRKLDWKHFGPFEVLEKINNVSYRLELPDSLKRTHDVFHVSLLSPHHTSKRTSNHQNHLPHYQLMQKESYMKLKI
jgi:hypothetical protein